MKHRVLGIVAAIALAAIGTVALVLFVRAAEDRALAGERTVDVLVVEQPVDQGTKAEDLANLVRAERVPAKVQASGSVADLSDLDGTVAAVDLVPGEQIVSTRFLTPEALQAQMQVDVPDGLQEVTISLEPQRAVGGQIQPGDAVGFIASFEPFTLDAVEPGQQPPPAEEQEDQVAGGADKTPNTTHFILHKVLVTNVQVERLPQQPEAGSEEESGPTPDLAPTGNLLITLAVAAPDAERAVFTAEFGRVWLTAEPETALEDGTTIQTRNSIYE